MNQRHFQPSLLWSLAENWYMKQLDTPPTTPYRSHDLTLYIYRTDEDGAWMLSGPKMYWQDTPITGDHFQNCDQDDLSENSEVLGECVFHDRKLRKTTLLGKTFSEAIEKINEA